MARASPRRRRLEAGLYRATTKSPSTAARSRCSMTGQGVSKSGQRDGAEVVPQRCAGEGRGAVHRRYPRQHHDLASTPIGMRRRLPPLEHQRRHGVHAGVAGADERHAFAPGGEPKGPVHALGLLAQRVGMPHLAGARGHLVEISPIPHQVRGVADGRVGRRGSPRGRARPEPDHRQNPAGAADPHGVDRRRRFGDRARGASRLRLRDPQRAVVAGRGERGRLRDAVAAHFPEHRVGRCGEPRGQGFEGGGSKNRAGSPRASASECTAGSSALRSTEKTPASDRVDRPARASVCRTRSSSSLAATPRSQPTPSARCRRWNTRVSASPASGASVTRTTRAASAWNSMPERRSHSASPSRRHGLSGQQPGHERLVLFPVCKHPPTWRIVQRHLPPGVADRGDRGGHTERLGEASANRVGAAVTAEQRHHRAAVFRDGDDRRLVALAVEDGPKGSDEDAGGAYPHDVHARDEQPAQLGPDVLESNVGVRHPRRVAVDSGSVERRCNPSGRDQALLRQHDDGYRAGHCMRRPVSVDLQSGSASRVARIVVLDPYHDRRAFIRSTRRRGREAGSSRSTARCLRRLRRAAGSSRSPWSRARRSGRARSDPSPRSRPGPSAGAGRP